MSNTMTRLTRESYRTDRACAGPFTTRPGPTVNDG